jgi:hypothetical protein
MQEEYGGRDLVAFPQYCHWGAQCFDPRPENQDGLLGHQPARMILEQPSFNAEPRSSYQSQAEEDSRESTRQARKQSRKVSDRNRYWPLKAHGGSLGDYSAEDEGRGRHKSLAPQEGIPRLNMSIRGLTHHGNSGEAYPLQFLEGPARCIPFCEVAYENACSHIPSLCFTARYGFLYSEMDATRWKSTSQCCRYIVLSYLIYLESIE